MLKYLNAMMKNIKDIPSVTIVLRFNENTKYDLRPREYVGELLSDEISFFEFLIS